MEFSSSEDCDLKYEIILSYTSVATFYSKVLRRPIGPVWRQYRFTQKDINNYVNTITSYIKGILSFPALYY